MGSEATLRIDADTARLISKMAEIAQKGETMTKSAAKMGKEVEGWEKGVDKFVGGIARMLPELSLAATAAAGLTKEFDNWEKNLERSREIAQSIITGVRNTPGAAAPSLFADRQAITGMTGTLTPEQRFQIYNQFKRDNPAASGKEAVDAVRMANNADASGVSGEEYARIYSKLRFAGKDAGDLAFHILKGGGSEGIDLITKANESLGADQAKALIPTMMAAAKTPGGIGALSAALSNFASQGRSGDFTQAFMSGSWTMVTGLDQQKAVKGIQGRVAAEQEAFGSVPGSMDRAQEAVWMSPEDRRDIGIRRLKAKTDGAIYSEDTAALQQHDMIDAGIDYAFRNQGFMRWGLKTAHTVSTFLAGNGSVPNDDDGTAAGVTRAIYEANEKLIQNMNNNRKPSLTVHGEP